MVQILEDNIYVDGKLIHIGTNKYRVRGLETLSREELILEIIRYEKTVKRLHSDNEDLMTKCDDVPVNNLGLIFDYLWKDEQKSYRENPSNNHIYLTLKKVCTWFCNSYDYQREVK